MNIRLDVLVEGAAPTGSWRCGLEFDFANPESFYCRPLRSATGDGGEKWDLPPEVKDLKVAFLPAMSGMQANEPLLQPGAVNVRIGEGRTAEVLRNLCFQVWQRGQSEWDEVGRRINDLFGVTLSTPDYIADRGEIRMSYRERSGAELDVICSGRGLQQTLLLLAHIAVNPSSILLLDEPDAHLEILRQRQIYQMVVDAAKKAGSQAIIASHSEVLLNEAANRDVVVAFVGKPHRIDDRGDQVLKSLREIGFDQYYQAQQKGWVLYVEGATDLAILQALARTLEHESAKYLERPFVHYVVNQPRKAQSHFHGLREAIPELGGFALFDRIEQNLPPEGYLTMRAWRRREIESYFCSQQVLLRWAEAFAHSFGSGDLFVPGTKQLMLAAITELESALKTLGKPSPWSEDLKITDEFLDPLFARFFAELKMPNLMRKSGYHTLAEHLTKEEVDPEVVEVLDDIVRIASKAEGRAR